MLKGMSLRGSLGTMSAEDVLEWVGRRKLSAPITFERRGLVRSLVVEDGPDRVGELEPPRRAARRDPRAERARRRARARRCARGARRDRRAAGQGAADVGLITEADLVEILATKIRETVTDVITWTRRAVRRRSAHARPRDRRQRAAPDRGLPDGRAPARRADGRDHGDPRRRRRRRSTCRRARRRRRAEAGEVVDAAKAWALAGDRHTAADIAAAFSGERFAAYDALASMVAGRPARRSIAATASARTPRSSSPPARAAGCARAIAPARSRWRRRRCIRIRAIAEVRKTFAQIERARVAEVAKQLLVAPPRAEAAARVPTRSPSTASPPPRSSSRNRVDGRWDLLSLVRSASVREAEALLAFAHLAEVGVVELG